MLKAWHLPVAPFIKVQQDRLFITLWLSGESLPQRITLRAEEDNEELSLPMQRLRQAPQPGVVAWRGEISLASGQPRRRYSFKLLWADHQRWFTPQGFTRFPPARLEQFAIDLPDAGPQWVADQVFYQIFPDRFANGNPANDSIEGYHQGVDRTNPGARHGGDIEGIIKRIPYLAELGITALWTTPVFDNNDVAYSYHHYGCTDYYKVDPRMGTNEDYRRLASVARDNGIKLILDVVPNHCSSAHWWLRDMPAKDWFNQWDTFTSSNYRMMAWMDPHRSDKDLKRLTHGWFAPNMPDFNLKNTLLFDYLTQVYIF